MKGNFLVGQMVSDWQDMDYLAQIVPHSIQRIIYSIKKLDI